MPSEDENSTGAARDGALHDIIARLRRENTVIGDDLERLRRRPRTTKDLLEIERLQNRMAVNEDVIRECEAQLSQNGA